MMINVNGRTVSTGASLDLLTRAVIISLFTWRRAGRDDDAPQIFDGGGYRLRFRMIARGRVCICCDAAS